MILQYVVFTVIFLFVIIPYLLSVFKIYKLIKNKERVHLLWILFIILYPVVLIGLTIAYFYEADVLIGLSGKICLI